MNKIFLGRSLEQLRYWAHENRKTLDKIFDLLHDVERNGAAKGIGKPEPDGAAASTTPTVSFTMCQAITSTLFPAKDITVKNKNVGKYHRHASPRAGLFLLLGTGTLR